MYYGFRVYAVNYNGLSPSSTVAYYYACTYPSNFAAPTVVTQSISAITLQWNPPGDSGGCEITGYAVFRDDGQNGAITTEVNTVNDPAVRQKPSLSSLTVTYFPPSSAGYTFKF